MYYVHRIFYLDLYQNQLKVRNCGFVKMEGFEDRTKFQFEIRKLGDVRQTDVEVFLTDGRKSEKIGTVKIQKNSIFQTIILPKAYQEAEIVRIDLLFKNQSRICYVQQGSKNNKKIIESNCSSSNTKNSFANIEFDKGNKENKYIKDTPPKNERIVQEKDGTKLRKEKENHEEKTILIRKQEDYKSSIEGNHDRDKNSSEEQVRNVGLINKEENEIHIIHVQDQPKVNNLKVQKEIVEESIIKDIAAAQELPDISDVKWEQLKNVYPSVHIFGENTETILIKPQDLVILPEAYQTLASNSFLLHGYYNYRQLLLSRWQIEEEIVYYIGVPGTYYDREKNVAVMFGFESFENGESSRRQGQKELYQGHFGYYMKKVEI